MEHDSSPSGGVPTARLSSAQSPAARVVGRESRHPWRRSHADSRLVVVVPSTQSMSPFSRLDLSGVTLGIFPHHD
jgi:hypothetical protein